MRSAPGMKRVVPTAKVVRIDLDRPLEPVVVEPGYRHLVGIAIRRGTYLGRIVLPAMSVVPADVLRAAVVRQLPDDVWHVELEQLFHEAVTADDASCRPLVSVSVVVCTRDRPDDLERCLESLGRLEPAPLEVIVVDSAPTGPEAREVCERFAVSYLHEPVIGQSRARNRGIAAARGEVVAFTDDDCVADPGWLSALADELADPRVAAVTGAVVPLELGTPAQWLFEMNGGHGRGNRRLVIDGTSVEPIVKVGLVGVGANVAFRRTALVRVGPFAEWLGPGTPARAADDYDMFCRLLDAGDRIVFSPRQLVWHRHRRELETLRSTFRDYGLSSVALATQRLETKRDRGARRVMRWWWLDRFPRELKKALRRTPDRLPLSMVFAEIGGTLAGRRALRQSRRSREGIPPVELGAHTSTGRRVELGPIRELPSLSVVVPTVGRSASLRRLLETLAAQSFPADRLEAVVVLDGATDDSKHAVEALELPYRVAVVPIERAGVAIARNRGVERASGDVVVFLDDDVVPHVDCLARHAVGHASGEADILLGYAPPVVGDDWWSLVLRAWWEDHFRRKADPTLPLRWSDVVTLNSSFRRTTLQALGGFDPAFSRRHEDWELGVRALRHGLRLGYAADAVAMHHLDTSLAGAVHRARDEARSDVMLARAHPDVALELPLAGHLEARIARGLFVPDNYLDRAARLEREGRRRAWRQLTNDTFRIAYLAGIQDELATEDDYDELSRLIHATRPHRVRLELGGASRIEIPPVGVVEFDVRLGGSRLGVIPSGRPGVPWDWDSVRAELYGHCWRAARRAHVEERLRELAASEARA
ncbi:MAG: glycosyltransferase [Gaiellales bacterium]